MGTNNQVTRLGGGITTSHSGTFLENLKMPYPAFYHQLFDDFDKFTAADWVVTATGAATETIGAGDGGLLVIQNTAANADLASIQYAGGTGAVSPTFLFEATRDMIFATSLKVDDATNADFLVGLAIADTTPIASLPVTGMYIHKAAAGLTPQGTIINASAGTTTTQSQIAMANDTFVNMAIIYTAFDGAVTMYLGGGSQQTPAPAFRVALAPTLPVALVAPIFALQNGTAAARSMTIDWYLAAKSRRAG